MLGPMSLVQLRGDHRLCLKHESERKGSNLVRWQHYWNIANVQNTQQGREMWEAWRDSFPLLHRRCSTLGNGRLGVFGLISLLVIGDSGCGSPGAPNSRKTMTCLTLFHKQKLCWGRHAELITATAWAQPLDEDKVVWRSPQCWRIPSFVFGLWHKRSN